MHINHTIKKSRLLVLSFFFAAALQGQNTAIHQVHNLKITILSTMLAQEGLGDWGFSALVETDSSKILFDTGGRDSIVRNNAGEVHVNLSQIPVVVLSHGHSDHTAGWWPLRRELLAVKSNALSQTYVAPGFFDERVFPSGVAFDLRPDSVSYVQSGGTITTVSTWTEIAPGVFLTGNDIPRPYAEKNYPPALKRKTPDGRMIQDTVPEDMSMVVRTPQGLVVITGCGHSGTMNLVSAITRHFPGEKVYAALGGFHLLAATDEQIKQTAETLKKAGLRYFMGAHCTGIEPVQQVMEFAGLKRNECIVGSVGASFNPVVGFVAGQLTMGRDKNAYFKK